MTKTARSIKNLENGKTNGYSIIAEEITNTDHEAINNYETMQTLFVFEDDSMILMNGNSYTSRIVYNSNRPNWSK